MGWRGEGLIAPAPPAGRRVPGAPARRRGACCAAVLHDELAEQAMRPPGRANQLAEQAMQAMREEQQEQQHLAEQAMQTMQEEQQAAMNELKQQLTNAQVQLAEQEDMPVSECVICLDEARIGCAAAARSRLHLRPVPQRLLRERGGGRAQARRRRRPNLLPVRRLTAGTAAATRARSTT